jgi:hypothetical protein
MKIMEMRGKASDMIYKPDLQARFTSQIYRIDQD